MTYDPTVWVDGGVPCIDDINLNNMEDGIDRAQGDIMILRGLTANIPASDPLLVGRFYFETDLLQRGWRDNGAGWDLVTVPAPYGSLLLETGQTTTYAIGDDGDVEAGVDKSYTVQTLGDYSGNVNIEVAHLADPTLSFTAPNTIASAGNLLVGWAVNDIMVIKGSASNDGVVTVTGVGGAPANLTISAAVNEIAGAVISLYKQTTHSNNAVEDDETGLMWSRNTSTGEAVGVASNGTLNWYDVATRFPLYAIANTVSLIMPGNIMRVIGGAALTQFHVGDCIMAAGFANPDNGYPNMYVVSATPNGADLDILVDPGNQVLVAEGAVGDALYLNTRSIYNYAAGARLGSLSNQTDWRVPNDVELPSLRNMEAPTAAPDAVAFPGWPAFQIWTSTTRPNDITRANFTRFDHGAISSSFKTTAYYCALVRGGT